MTPQERDLITDLFRRLREADSGPRDREADELIRRLSTEHAGAAYLLTQTVIVQDQALTTAQARIEELQRQLAATSRPAESGSFLGGLFGGRRPTPPPQPAAQPPSGPWGAPQSGPWTGQPQSGPWAGGPPHQPGPWGAPQPAAGGGFLQSALTTAVGVAGGALLFEGVSHMFGGGSANAASFGSATPPIVENTTINNYYGDPSDDGDNDGATDFDTGSDSGSFFDDV